MSAPSDPIHEFEDVPKRRGLKLDRVVLLGRTLEEYRRYFDLDLDSLHGCRVLDVASGVSSFTAEASAEGLDCTAADPIYGLENESIRTQCEQDLDEVVRSLHGLDTYKWEFYKNPNHMRGFRERAYRTFLEDRCCRSNRYLASSLPRLPFSDRAFNLTLTSYFLFVYEAQLDWKFHLQSLLEIMRVTSGEARIYPLMTFEGVPSQFLSRLASEPALESLEFTVVPTRFEFLVGSNAYLRIRHRRAG